MTLSRYEHTGDAPATGLASGVAPTDTSFTVNSGTGYPTGAVGKFVICLDPGTTSEEKVLCSARSGTTFTVAGGGRGYDDTTATSHGSGSTNVTHVLSAAEIDDFSDHVYTTTRDDHTQYARTDGSRAVTGNQTYSSGVTVSGGGAAITGNTSVTGTLTSSQALTASSGGVQATGNSKVTGTLEVTQATTIDAGGLTVTAGGLTVSAGGAAITGTLTGSSTVQGTAAIATGLTGATAASRYVGATTSGAPASGTFAKGDFVIDQTAAVWVCTTAGTPGTWTQVGASVSGGIASGGEVSGTDFKATGLTGATSASRYVGATASGAPASGTFAVGDVVVDQSGAIWECTTAGTPGTWKQVGVPVTLDGVFVGSAPSATTPLKAYEGSFTVTTLDSNGEFTHNFPTAFTTGYTLVVSPGDHSDNLGMVVPLPSQSSLSQFECICYGFNGSVLASTGPVRINYRAVGA